MKMKKSSDGKSPARSSRAFKNGAASSLMVTFAVVAVLLINLVVEFLPTKYTEIDVSADKMYELSDTTEQLLAGLDQDVSIYYLCQTGGENDIVVNLLDRYAGASSHVTWEQKDPAVYPTFAAQYGAEKSTMGSSVVVSGDTVKVIDAKDYYNYEFDYNYGQFRATSLDAENQFSSAIQFVTSESGDFPKVYQLTGHGEASLYGKLKGALETQNIQLENLALLSVSEIPADADTVVINNPTVDFTQEDLTILRNYLNQGGSLLVTTNARTTLPNLQGLMAEYGMTGQPGLIVEGDESRHMRSYAHYLLPIVADTSATSKLEKNSSVMIPFAQGIELDQEREDVKVKPLLTTSEQAYNKADGVNAATTAREDKDEIGSFTVAAQAEKTIDEDTSSRVIWINSGDMLTTDADTLAAGANGTFALGCFNWLSDAESQVLVGAKSLESETLVFTAGQVTGFSLLFVIGIPLAILVLGAVVVIRRRAR